MHSMMLGFSEARFFIEWLILLQTLCLSETFYGIIHFVTILQMLRLSETFYGIIHFVSILQTLCLSETFYGMTLLVTNVASLRDFYPLIRRLPL